MPSAVNLARQEIERLRLALLQAAPQPMELSIVALEAAIEGMRLLDARHVPELKNELVALRADLARVSRLIESGAALHEGWAKVVGAALGGYTPSGSAAPLTAASRVSVKG
jgi:hypothetical protein